jgi:hypothetical protein
MDLPKIYAHIAPDGRLLEARAEPPVSVTTMGGRVYEYGPLGVPVDLAAPEQVEYLLTKLALLARSGCQEILGRDFSDDEKASLSRGYEALEKVIQDIVLGEPVAFVVTEGESC